MQLQSSSESEWDQLIRERFSSAHDREGWMSGQLLSPADAPNVRVIVGTWRNQRDWEAWHEDPAFLSTRARLDELQQVDHQTVWYNVIEEAQANDD
ncbi:antibiotic biosynthesis monooxygenase family protein [Paenarthrobacter sp. TA1.8]|uniref:antibiotic biosynthesis monooxygenase family protein n=1 Tax=Paenarthrobacter sp. TA1.8 TaxID=3400219 RepID=UPI003B4360BE